VNKTNKTKADKKEEALPATVEDTEKELTAVREKKATAVEKEDFDTAHALKSREKALSDHLARLQAASSEL
jgi:hypothetical protein